jgi:hypothetical protein
MKEYADTICVFKPCPCCPAFSKAAETSCYVISKGSVVRKEPCVLKIESSISFY